MTIWLLIGRWTGPGTGQWFLLLQWIWDFFYQSCQLKCYCSTAQWAKSGFFVQWVYWVYLSSQNTRPLCNAAMYEQV